MPNRVLVCALLVLALSPAVADGRVRAADLAVERVIADEAQGGRVKVSFTVFESGSNALATGGRARDHRTRGRERRAAAAAPEGASPA